MSNTVQAALWMVFAGTCYVIGGACTRYLGGDYSALELVFLRSVIATILLFPVFARIGFAELRTTQFPLHLGRSFLTYSGLLCWFYAVSQIPLAEYYALQFTMPLFTIAGAVIFLGERAGPRTWLATTVGLCGVLIILRPGFQAVGFGLLAALGAGISYAGVNVCVKVLARRDGTAAIVAYANFLVLILALGPAIAVWQTPTWAHLPFIAGVAVFSTLGQLSLTKAISLADARVVQPFDFVRLPVATLFGWMIFAELPDIWTWVGAVVIFAAAYYVLLIESRAPSPARGGHPATRRSG